jgi:RND family efflux transporter MFP subunit
MISRLRFLGLVLAGALIAGTSSCSKSAAAGADSSKTAAKAGDDGGGTDRSSLSLPVVAEDVRDGDLILSVNTTGQVRSDADSKLKSEVSGVVAAVLIRPGDQVKKGQELVRFDTRPFDLAVKEAESAVSEANLRYLDQFVPDSLATGQGPGEERRRNARVRSGLAGAEVRLEKAKLDLERATIVAPFDGVVDRVDVAPGERVQSGQSITAVVDLNNLRIEAAVLEHDLPLIKVGGQAVVSSSAAPDQQTIGRVVAVLPIVDSTTRAGRAYVRVPGSAVLRPGMYADVRLEATRLANRRLVPARAVIERDGRPLVFVVQSGRAKWTYINPGRSNGVETEVLPDSASGQIPVNPGDKVIVEGHLTLTHDAPVRVVASRENADAPEKKKP